MLLNRWYNKAVVHIRQNKVLVGFLSRAGLIYLAWFLIYNTNQTIPFLLNRFLTTLVAKLSVLVLRVIDEGYTIGTYHLSDKMLENSFTGGNTAVYLNGKTSVGIADTCNGLELFVLFAGYILAYPQRWKIKLLFIAGGIPLLMLLNILRIVALASIYEYLPNFFLFAHHYLFTATMYIGIFLIWYRFSNVTYAQR